MSKKKNGLQLTAIISLILGILFLLLSIIIWNLLSEGFWADKQSEFFIVGIIMIIGSLTILIFKKKISFG